MREIERVKTEEQKHWETLSMGQKMREWAMKNQYKVILSSWAVSLGIAGAIVMANKHQTKAQKIVQARMWAQGLTVGVLIGAGVLTHSQREQAFKERVSAFRSFIRNISITSSLAANRSLMG
jgi:hypothetical protein